MAALGCQIELTSLDHFRAPKNGVCSGLGRDKFVNRSICFSLFINCFIDVRYDSTNQCRKRPMWHTECKWTANVSQIAVPRIEAARVTLANVNERGAL